MNIKRYYISVRVVIAVIPSQLTSGWLAFALLGMGCHPPRCPAALPRCTGFFKNARTGQPKESSARRSRRRLQDKRDYTLLCRKVQRQDDSTRELTKFQSRGALLSAAALSATALSAAALSAAALSAAATRPRQRATAHGLLQRGEETTAVLLYAHSIQVRLYIPYHSTHVGMQG